MSLWQLQEQDSDRWERYRTDRAAAAREALRRLLGSLRACRESAPELRLAAFASGTCAGGHKAARELDAAVRRALTVPRRASLR